MVLIPKVKVYLKVGVILRKREPRQRCLRRGDERLHRKTGPLARRPFSAGGYGYFSGRVS